MFYFLDRILLRLQSARRISAKNKSQRALSSAQTALPEPSAGGARRPRKHPWLVAHEETNVSRDRAVLNAAMNHWFVCNKVFPNRIKVMTYDPYGSFTDSVGIHESS